MKNIWVKRSWRLLLSVNIVLSVGINLGGSEPTKRDNFKIEEVPMKSVDRLFGGSSTFKPLPWIKEYLRWFFWGIKRVRRFNKEK